MPSTRGIMTRFASVDAGFGAGAAGGSASAGSGLTVTHFHRHRALIGTGQDELHMPDGGRAQRSIAVRNAAFVLHRGAVLDGGAPSAVVWHRRNSA
jgi:hypothetical protein